MLVVETFLAPSPIHGIGLFARAAIPRGTVVWQYAPEFEKFLPLDLVRRLPRVAQRFVDSYGHPDLLDGVKGYFVDLDDARFINHGNAPNLIWDGRPDTPYLAARDIAAGEELTCDYRQFEPDVVLQPDLAAERRLPWD